MASFPYRVHTKHPGGNAVLERHSDDEVLFAPDLRDTEGWWFYWNFRVEGAAGRTVRFRADKDCIGPFGPAVSRDGVHWAWLGSDSLETRACFRHRFETDDPTWFSFCIPYTQTDFDRYLLGIGAHPAVERKILARSEGGREVPLLVLGDEPHARKHLLLTARHHACEAPASFALEGMIGYFLKHRDAWADLAIHIIPFIDLDGVERGDQGKNRMPHDHNRDYLPQSIYAPVKALMEYAGTRRMRAFLDLHAPYLWGGRNDHAFIVMPEEPHLAQARRFSDALKASCGGVRGSLPFDPIHEIAHGMEWNTGAPSMAATWFQNQGVPLSLTLEIPYFGTTTAPVTPEALRHFGVATGAAICACCSN